MKDRINRIISGRDWVRPLPLVLVFLTVVSYGLLIPWMGFYWDDFPVAWIADRLGQDGLSRYFSDNRPWLSWLYGLSMPLLGTQVPWHWQVFALLTRFTTALSFFGLVRTTWPKLTQLAVWASFFFLVYPGFKQHWVAIIYGHFFLILTGLLVSFYLSVKIIRWKSYTSEISPGSKLAVSRKTWLLSIAAWFLALQNLLFLDYFFFLELIRPVLLWVVSGEQFPGRKKRLQKTFQAWLPYLVLWVGFVIWRFVTLESQPHFYQVTLFDQLKEAPLPSLKILAGDILRSFWIAIPVAWGRIFQLPDAALGLRTRLTAVVLTGFVFVVLSIYLFLMSKKHPLEIGSKKGALAFIWTGLLACLLAGWAIWLPGLGIGTEFAKDRFSLVFMPGAALILAGFIGLLPGQKSLTWVLVALFTSLAVGQQFITANKFRQEWEFLQRFFWQLTWRVPALERGTLLLADEFPFTYYTDNSLTAPVNWIYASENRSLEMSYLLFYPARRLGTTLPGLEPGLAVYVDYLAATYNGNTSQATGLVFEPPACLRVLDPDLDIENKMLTAEMQQTASISSTSPIQAVESEKSVYMPISLFGEEPAHRWCYYFEKADLARQQGDWELVAALGDQAFGTGDYPNDPMERLTFIEGYAHVSDWSRALALTRDAHQISSIMQPVLCRLWGRIEKDTLTSPEKDEALRSVVAELNCQ